MNEVNLTLDSPDISANRLEVIHGDFADLKDFLKTGTIAKFSIRPFLNNNILDWSLEDWSLNYGDSIINLHRIKCEKELLSYLNSKGVEGYLDFKNHILQKTLLARRAVEKIKISTLIERMKSFKDIPLPPNWYSDCEIEAEKFYFKKLSAYGVINTKKVPNFNFTWPDVLNSWSEVFNFLWFGLTPGGLHIDELDNTLIQLHGKKRVLIYHPALFKAVDGNHYPKSFDPSRPFSPTNLRNHKFFKYLPYTIVDLNPGEGVIIPAFAYHAPHASTYDSISMNSFLLPKIRKGPFSYYQRLSSPSIAFLKSARYLYKWTGLIIAKIGPYEII